MCLSVCLLPSSLILNEENAVNFERYSQIFKKLAADKHVNLFSFDLSDKEKKFYTLDTWLGVIEHVFNAYVGCKGPVC